MSELTPPTASSAGPILLGAVLQSFCQGVVMLQTVKYWEMYPEDTIRMKLFVTFIAFLSLFQTILEIYKLWLTALIQQPWSQNPLKWTDVLINGMVVFLCQLYLIRKCWKATNRRYFISIPLTSISATIFVADVFLAVQVGKVMGANDPLRNNSKLVPSSVFAFSYWIFGSLVLNSVVTVIMVTFLWRSKTGVSYLDKVLRHIISITWESAALPFVSMLVAACIYHARSRVSENYHLVLLFVLMTGKLYNIGLMRTLNARQDLRSRMHSTDLGRTTLSAWQWDQERTSGLSSMKEIPPTLVTIDPHSFISPQDAASDDLSMSTRDGPDSILSQTVQATDLRPVKSMDIASSNR
ncbi:hypothetical protein JAAARDRAFT_201722 [Jaapia argillacea MUCL 33604]|uniref:DUF6534 domain-containing protein n=1 Tax=Jaapia argillacea MUCL 33604 TaxID=933084 RepID=A0A067QP09_9AGAM|nr:hypothetical protein JAAARDRAFT_201722 [Jaapia argillacea MUCL 33604]